MSVDVVVEAARGRGRALVVLCVMQLMIILDGTVVTVALPTIRVISGFRRRGWRG